MENLSFFEGEARVIERRVAATRNNLPELLETHLLDS